MSSSLERFRRPPNPVTQAAFRRQVRLEIYLPLGLVLLALVVLVVAVVVVGYGTKSAWADVAVVLLAAPLAVLLLIVMGVLGGAAYLMFRLIREIPPVTGGLQEGVDRVAGAIQRGSDVAVRPVIGPSGVAAALGEVGRAVRSIFRGE